MSSGILRATAVFGTVTMLYVAAAVAWSTRSQPAVPALGAVCFGSVAVACFLLVRGASLRSGGRARGWVTGMFVLSLAAAGALFLV